MNKDQAFCTIVTDNYFAWALTLYDSLEQYDPDIMLYVAIIDKTVTDHSSKIKGKNIKILTIDDLINIRYAQDIVTKYAGSIHVQRWALKSVLLMKSLEYHSKAIFIDADIYFFNSYQFLFDLLETSSVLLTPHWRPSKPTINKQEFETNFKHGLYNAGFIGANTKGIQALEFWAESCFIFCGKNVEVGLYHDQTYLNLLPIYFENVGIVRHKGCNIGSWNMEECKRTLNKNNEVVINNTHPIVFIHFSNVTIDGILKGMDAMLLKYLHIFNDNLIKNGFKNLVKDRLDYFEKLRIEENKGSLTKLVDRAKLIYYKIRYQS